MQVTQGQWKDSNSITGKKQALKKCSHVQSVTITRQEDNWFLGADFAKAVALTTLQDTPTASSADSQNQKRDVIHEQKQDQNINIIATRVHSFMTEISYADDVKKSSKNTFL